MIRRTLTWVMPVLIVTGICLAQEGEEQVEKKVEKNPIVEIQTNHGNIYLDVFLNETPIHAKNFLSKVDEGKYDGLIFHRVIKNFVVQGGSPDSSGTGSMGTGPLPDEKMPAPPEVRGTVAMARSGLGASDCQFYINLKDNTRLDSLQFTSFAKVMQGMDVVDEISKVKVNADDRPVEDVVMTRLSRVEKVPAKAPEKSEGE